MEVKGSIPSHRATLEVFMDMSRILDNIIVNEEGCWVWKRSTNSAGYGQLTENKKYWLAHRYSYSCVNQDLKTTDVVRHICHNPKCCNPDHLVVGTHKDNWHDSEVLHRKKAALSRSEWSVKGIKYGTMREAQQSTGISLGALARHTKEGVFNIETYRAACKKANTTPKV